MNIQKSIDLLQRTEQLALEYSPDGFHLAFSGGKDSQCLYHIAQMAGVKFKAHCQLTTLDPPELVKFIKDNYPDVIIHRPKMTFLQLCLKKHILPTQTMRFCCAELKESAGANTVTLTGVRRAESVKRSKRNEVEVSNHKFSGTIDQFNREKESEIVCVSGKDKIIVNPIIDWTDKDVWTFLNKVVKVPHCTLYDEGWHRIGCLFCPMASLKELRRMEVRYPRYKAAFIRTIHKLREGNFLNDYPDATDEEVFEWWISKRNAKTFFCDLKNQLKLF
jgi:phosphoadenosine phosphosulfate reductase